MQSSTFVGVVPTTFAANRLQPVVCPGREAGSILLPGGQDQSVQMRTLPFVRPRWQDGSIVVVEEEAPVHTPQNPYCGDLRCWCRTDLKHHNGVTGAPTQDGEISTSRLDGEIDDDWFDAAMALLGVK